MRVDLPVVLQDGRALAGHENDGEPQHGVGVQQADEGDDGPLGHLTVAAAGLFQTELVVVVPLCPPPHPRVKQKGVVVVLGCVGGFGEAQHLDDLVLEGVPPVDVHVVLCLDEGGVAETDKGDCGDDPHVQQEQRGDQGGEDGGEAAYQAQRVEAKLAALLQQGGQARRGQEDAEAEVQRGQEADDDEEGAMSTAFKHFILKHRIFPLP